MIAGFVLFASSAIDTLRAARVMGRWSSSWSIAPVICSVGFPVKEPSTGISPARAGTLPRRKPRRRLHWVAYLWPGLPHLWVRGSLAGLTLALAFSVVLNVLVLGTLVWPAWLESRLKFACALTGAILWVAALWETRGELRRLAAEREAAEIEPQTNQQEPNQLGDELLRTAQGMYLRGDWLGAERTLRKAIRRDRDDFEARFWLVSVLRQAGRPQQAERLLRRVERRDAAAAWPTEIIDERRRLTAALNIDDPATDDQEPTILPIRDSAQESSSEADREAA